MNPISSHTSHSNCTRCAVFERLAGETYATSDGKILVLRGSEIIAIYCPSCAQRLQYCRVCGCTEERACPGGCAWAETGLCSQCYLPDQDHPLIHPQWAPWTLSAWADHDNTRCDE